MKLSEQTSEGPVLISGYGNGGFRLGDHRHEGSLLVFGGEIFPWAVKTPKQITKASLKPVLEKGPEFLLLGLGIDLVDPVILSRKLSQSFGISVEVMSTGAAARTYNVLTLEGRPVAVGLLAI